MRSGATAFLDRFLHRAEVIAVTGKSYRRRNQATPTGPSDEESKPANPPTDSAGRLKQKPARVSQIANCNARSDYSTFTPASANLPMRGWRPHSSLGGQSNEIYFCRKPVNPKRRLKPRAKWPRGSPCAEPQARGKGKCGVRFTLHVRFHAGHQQCPSDVPHGSETPSYVDIARVAARAELQAAREKHGPPPARRTAVQLSANFGVALVAATKRLVPRHSH